MRLEKRFIPAIIAKNQHEFEERIAKVNKYVDLIQLDIMDGRFVPNTSLDFDFKLPPTTCTFEAHLMIDNPKEWINTQGSKVNMILIHFESTSDHETIIDLVKKKGKQVGFVLNPETPAKNLQPYLNQIDQILIMTVEPGFYGSPFLPEMVPKIQELRRLKSTLNIEVDGGITPDTINIVDSAGANMFVSGSYIVKADDVQHAITSLKQKIKGKK